MYDAEPLDRPAVAGRAEASKAIGVYAHRPRSVSSLLILLRAMSKVYVVERRKSRRVDHSGGRGVVWMMVVGCTNKPAVSKRGKISAVKRKMKWFITPRAGI